MMSKDPGASVPKIENLNKLMDYYKDLLMPDQATEKDDQAKKLQKVFEEEIGRGPFKVQSMMTSKRGKTRKG